MCFLIVYLFFFKCTASLRRKSGLVRLLLEAHAQHRRHGDLEKGSSRTALGGGTERGVRGA